jgi:hypothetical protein
MRFVLRQMSHQSTRPFKLRVDSYLLELHFYNCCCRTLLGMAFPLTEWVLAFCFNGPRVVTFPRHITYVASTSRILPTQNGRPFQCMKPPPQRRATISTITDPRHRIRIYAHLRPLEPFYVPLRQTAPLTNESRLDKRKLRVQTY